MHPEGSGTAVPAAAAHGVQALVDRLREEGVEAGRREAERLLAAARDEAQRLVSDAREQAQALAESARAAIEVERSAAHEGLRLAWRDALLSLRDEVEHRFGERLRRRLHEQLEDGVVLRRLALAAGSGSAVADEDLRDVAAATLSGLLAEGIELVPRAGSAALLLRHREAGQVLEFTDEALAAWLLERLAPPFRQLLGDLPREMP
jgi:V/A-type H+/Na+-transporting ATPase subunit E